MEPHHVVNRQDYRRANRGVDDSRSEEILIWTEYAHEDEDDGSEDHHGERVTSLRGPRHRRGHRATQEDE
jgi:hypothetical protein